MYPGPQRSDLKWFAAVISYQSNVKLPVNYSVAVNCIASYPRDSERHYTDLYLSSCSTESQEMIDYIKDAQKVILYCIELSPVESRRSKSTFSIDEAMNNFTLCKPNWYLTLKPHDH